MTKALTPSGSSADRPDKGHQLASWVFGLVGFIWLTVIIRVGCGCEIRLGSAQRPDSLAVIFEAHCISVMSDKRQSFLVLT
jgi:hypothetical protein